jgi:hypothetical protein
MYVLIRHLERLDNISTLEAHALHGRQPPFVVTLHRMEMQQSENEVTNDQGNASVC